MIVVAAAALTLAGLLSACSRPDEDSSTEAALSASSRALGSAAWQVGSSSAPTLAGTSGAAPSATPSSAPTTGASVEPAALAELVAAAPKKLGAATGADGASLIGTETGEKSASEPEGAGLMRDAGPAPSTAANAEAQKNKVTIGALSIQGEMASPSLERAARAQLYWPLVQRCRDKAGKILPPDAILILFRIDEDGYIVGSSISATPSKPEFEDAAHCMRRELSAATFRAPLASRGVPTAVTMTAPSVD